MDKNGLLNSCINGIFHGVVIILITIALFFILVIIIKPVNAWSCDTHKYICQDLVGVNCCIADNREYQGNFEKSAPYWHHCSNNNTDCEARVAAEYHKANNNLDMYYHLVGDSYSPPHWYSTDYNSCHGLFERKVERHIENNDTNWEVEVKCISKVGDNITLFADDEYIESVRRIVTENRANDEWVKIKEHLIYNNTSPDAINGNISLSKNGKHSIIFTASCNNCTITNNIPCCAMRNMINMDWLDYFIIWLRGLLNG